MMHLFYTPDIENEDYTLSAEESKHCVKVLRYTEGEAVALVDGRGNWYDGVIVQADLRGCRVKISRKIARYGQRPIRLHLAVAPTKNMERTEWMLEKCTEMGIDEVTLLDTAYSERKAVKAERLEKVIVSAMKQSLKAYLPRLNQVTQFKDFVTAERSGRLMIAHCHSGEKKGLAEVYRPGENAVILIGPEGDFSPEEVALAEANGYVPISLGQSRLRTETAGIVACHSVNFMNRL